MQELPVDFNVKVSSSLFRYLAVKPMREFYTITELTREFGVSTRTLRFYEDENLIKPVRRGRTRLYRPADRELLKQILRGKRLGFSIAEIREIIEMYKAPLGAEGQMKALIDKIGSKRAQLEQKKLDIEETMRELDAAEENCFERLAELRVSQ